MMNRFSFFLIFLTMYGFLYAQHKTISSKNENFAFQIEKGDSLYKAKNNEAALNIYKNAIVIALDNKDYDSIITLYKKIGILYYRKKNYTKAEYMYRNYLGIDSTTKTAADIYYNIFLVKRKLKQQDSILPYLEKSLVLYKTFNDNKSAYNAFLSAGIIYKNRQFYDKALEFLILSYNGYTDIENKKKLASVCTTIGNVQNHLQNYNQALEYHKQALNIETKLKNNKGIGRCYTNLGNTNKNLKLIDSAISNYKKALTFFNNKSNQFSIALSNLANTYIEKGDFDLAKKSFAKSVAVNKFNKNTSSLLYNYNGLTSLYLKTNAIKTAKAYLDSTKPLIPKISDKIIKLDYFENQVEYNQKIKDYKVALKFQVNYSNLYKTIYNLEQTEIAQNIQSRFEHKKKENEILKLTLSNKNVQLELIKKNKAINNKNLILLVLVLLLSLSIIIFFLLAQKQKMNKQNIKIEKLEAIYQGQETIKKRIARDLHDIITTNFDGLRLRILALKKSTKKEELIDETTTELKKINQQIRVVSHRLSPLEMQMSNQKFTDIIKSRLSEFQLYGHVFVELENQLPETLNTMNSLNKDNFYGILLEILNNVEKHSHATKIVVKNYTDKNRIIHFVFTDNGIGIKNNAKEGIGLLNIRQRCEIIKGNCSIKKVESGTEVRVSFPLKTKQ